MGTYIIAGILVIVVIFAVRSMMSRATKGCCDTGDSNKVKKVKVSDRNRSHYPYEAVVAIDGMMCEGCANTIQNAYNSMDGVYAKVSLSDKKADVLMKEKLDDALLRKTVNQIGSYVAMDVKWIQG